MIVSDGGILAQLPDQEYIILEGDEINSSLTAKKMRDDDVQVIVEKYDVRHGKYLDFLFANKEFLDKKDKYILSEEYDEKIENYVFKLMLLDDGLRQFIEQTKWEAKMETEDPFWYMKATIGDIEEKYGIKIDFDELLKNARAKADKDRKERKRRGPTIDNGRIVVGSIFDVLREKDPLYDEKISLVCEIAKIEDGLKHK